MKRTLGLVPSIRLLSVVGLAMLGLTASGPRAQANVYPFTHTYIFGDSLLDTGNYYRLSDGLPAAPYAGGRFCNGPIWVEYLASYLRMDYEQADNFAVAGATTGTMNSNDVAGKEYPGLLDEIAWFQSLGPVSEPERALYIVGAGPNDFSVGLAAGMSPATLIGNGVYNTVAAIQQLWGLGARYILVMNVPDLGLTPRARTLGPGGPSMLTQLSAAYNQALELALGQLAQAGIPTIRLNAFAVVDAMAYTPAAYGFSDVTSQGILAPQGANLDQFLFFDEWHPTTGAHRVLAHEALEELIRTFSPSNGQGTPDAKANSLHGLVNASLHHE